jgi:hypothetical protein
MATSERRADKPFGKLVFKLRDERLQACDGGLLLCDNGKEFGFACGIHALVYPTKSQIMLGAVLRGGWVVTIEADRLVYWGLP